MPIIILRLFGAPLLFIAYIVFQVIFRKKTWGEIRQDMKVTGFFIVVYALLYWLLVSY